MCAPFTRVSPQGGCCLHHSACRGRGIHTHWCSAVCRVKWWLQTTWDATAVVAVHVKRSSLPDGCIASQSLCEWVHAVTKPPAEMCTPAECRNCAQEARKSIRVSIAQKTNKCCSPGVFSQTALGVRFMPAAVIRSNMGSETELSFL